MRTATRLAAFTTVVVLSTVPSAALATPPPAVVESCVVVLEPLRADEATSTVLERTCGGSDATSLRDVAGVAAVLVIGIEYQDASFGGASTTYVGSTACSAGAQYAYANMAAGWDNAISSARSYQGCQSRHYDGTNFTGSSYLCGCAAMGSMNDKTSSIRFF